MNFVPEQKTVESLLEFFRSSKTDTAIVVDEYGGIAGTVSLEDIVEELVGPIEPLKGIEPVKQLGPMTYRLAGSLAIHDWADAFGIDVAESRLATIGGLVVALLGKIPRTGDVARLRNLKFTVELVRKHRIESIVLELMPLETPQKPERRPMTNIHLIIAVVVMVLLVCLFFRHRDGHLSPQPLSPAASALNSGAAFSAFSTN